MVENDEKMIDKEKNIEDNANPKNKTTEDDRISEDNKISDEVRISHQKDSDFENFGNLWQDYKEEFDELNNIKIQTEFNDSNIILDFPKDNRQKFKEFSQNALEKSKEGLKTAYTRSKEGFHGLKDKIKASIEEKKEKAKEREEKIFEEFGSYDLSRLEKIKSTKDIEIEKENEYANEDNAIINDITKPENIIESENENIIESENITESEDFIDFSNEEFDDEIKKQIINESSIESAIESSIKETSIKESVESVNDNNTSRKFYKPKAEKSAFEYILNNAENIDSEGNIQEKNISIIKNKQEESIDGSHNIKAEKDEKNQAISPQANNLYWKSQLYELFLEYIEIKNMKNLSYLLKLKSLIKRIILNIKFNSDSPSKAEELENLIEILKTTTIF